MPKPLTFTEIVEPRPMAPDSLVGQLSARDGHSDHNVPHRALENAAAQQNDFITVMRQCLITHHAQPEALERDRRRREALARQGFHTSTRRFPTSPTTQKGNWGEIFLAEYLMCVSDVSLPVYRLRYNPNVEQSMKGDDVLVFDLDSDPVRIIVGEAKYRATPSNAVVDEIIELLEKAHRAGLPVSLQFVADRLFEQGEVEIGQKVEECSDHFVRGNLRLDHIGLLVSDTRAARYVDNNAESSVRRLAMISLGLDDPNDVVELCFRNLDDDS